jgi:hypothetical protein
MRKGDHDEPAYEGRAGRTRRELVHWSAADGAGRSGSFPRVVNLGTDPHLRDGLLAGSLHRADGGEELAIPTVVHDPGARRVVLFLPEALRHHEIAEKARWFAQLAEDHEALIPRYAKEPRVAVGLAQLRAVLSEAPAGVLASREAALVQKEDALAKREDVVVQREQRLRERAEQITRREDEIREKTEENEAGVRDLAMRESELESRLAALVDRERALADKEKSFAEKEKALADRDRALVERERTAGEAAAAPPAVVARPGERAALPAAVAAPAAKPASADATGKLEAIDDEIIEEGTNPRGKVSRSAPPKKKESIPPPRPTLAAPAPIAAIVPDEDVVEEIDELEPVSTSPGLKNERTGRFGSRDAIEVREADVVEQIPTDAVEEIVDEDDVEEEIDDDMLALREDVTGLHATKDEETKEELSGPRTTIASAAVVAAAVDPNAVPADVKDLELAWKLGEGVELFARLAPEKAGDAAELELDAIVQLVPADADKDLRALVLLTLVDAGRTKLARAALDPRDPADRLLLEALRRKFEARVVLHDGAKRLAQTKVGAPRELNVARILDRASRLRLDVTPDAADKARAASLEVPLPDGHPLLGEALEKATDAVTVRGVIREVAEAMAPERLDDAMVYASVPRDAIDVTVARVIERALAHGLALPSVLTERAVATGLATDVGELVSRQIDAFRATVASEGAAGLAPEAIAENWERLLASATDNEIALDSETHDLAHQAIRAVRGTTPSVPPGGEVDPARIADAGVPELLLMLDHPRYRRAAAVALAERSGADHVDALCKAVRKMPRAEVVRVVPHIARIGEEAGDALIDGLSAKKTFVRHAFAIALGQLRLRRAVVPLLHVLLGEQSDVWKDVARVFGTFGNASLRALSRQIADGKGPDERIVTALAHLANHGCEDALVQMKKDPDVRTVRLAEQALSQREAAREREEMVAGKRPVDPSAAELVFARRFVEELEGKAPEGDLAGPADE